MKKQIITIAGRPGSGKSTVAKALAERLNYEHFSSGDLFRELAKKGGKELLEANVSAENNSDIDHQVDKRLQEMYAKGDHYVFDSRTAWHWMSESFKVFLDLDIETAATRVLKGIEERKEVNERIPLNTSEYSIVLQDRLKSENRRYKSLYGIDPSNFKNYDLVVDTKVNNAEQVIEIVYQAFQKWLKQQG